MTKSKYDRWPSLRLYEKLRVPYIVTSEEWQGPLWTGHSMILSTRGSYGDPGFFHELMHWLAATPEQRQHPDMALGRNVDSGAVEFTSSTTPHVSEAYPSYARDKKRNTGWGEKTILTTKANEQEVWACHALFYYEALTGLTTWDEPPMLGKINNAAFDFAGQPSNIQFTEEVARGVHERFVKPLKGGTLRQIIAYTAALEEMRVSDL